MISDPDPRRPPDVPSRCCLRAARMRAAPILDWFQKIGETLGVPATADFEVALRGAPPRVTRLRRYREQPTQEAGEGSTCLTVAVKARTQQSPPRLPSRLGRGRTRTGGRIS